MDVEKIIEELEKIRDKKCSWGEVDIINQAIDILKKNNCPESERLKTGHWIVLDDCANSGIYCSQCSNKIFDRTSKPKKPNIDDWFRKMMNMPIEIPQAYIDGWNTGREHGPFDDKKSITWQCGYEDGRYNLSSSLL